MIEITYDATSIRFVSQPDVDGNYNAASIDATYARGTVRYDIARSTNIPHNASKDRISFYELNTNRYIAGGAASDFADMSGVSYGTVDDIASDLADFFFPEPGFVEAAAPGVIFVSPAGDDANPGTMQNPRLSINQALTDVSAGGEVVCLPGTYTDYITAVNGKTLRLEPGVNFTYTMTGDRHWFSDNGSNVVFSIIAVKGANNITVTAATAQTVGNAIYIGGNSNITIRGLQVTVSSSNIQASLMNIAGAGPNITLEECFLYNASGSSHALVFTSTASGSTVRLNESTLQNTNSIAAVRIAGNHVPRFRNVTIYKVFGSLSMDSPTGLQNVDIYSTFVNKNYDTTNITLKVNPGGLIFNSAVRP